MAKRVNRRKDARGERVGDVADYLDEGEEFAVTWRFTNKGETAWDDSYTLFQTGRVYGFNKDATPDPLGAARRLEWDELTDVATVTAGETVDFTVSMRAPEEGGDYVCHWQLRDAEQNNVGYPVYVRVSVPTLAASRGGGERGTIPTNLESIFLDAPMKLGMNINPDDPQAHADAAALKGVGMVRIVFKSYLREAGKTAHDHEWKTIEHYKKQIAGYNVAGIDVLLVINQESVVPAGGWKQWDTPINKWQDGEWAAYVTQFAETAAKIADQLKWINQKKAGSVAFQIWNEGDQLEADALASIVRRNNESDAGTRKYTLKDAYTLPMEEGRYAILLKQAAQAIKQKDSHATVVAMGLVRCDVGYLSRVDWKDKAAFQHVDAVSAHPYSCVAAGFQSNFWFASNYKNFSSVLSPIAGYAASKLKLPLWITEVGPKPKDPTDQIHIANYMRATFHDFALNHKQVEAVFWFPWTDFAGTMETSSGGILSREGDAKTEMWKAFEEVRNWLADEPVTVDRPTGGAWKREPKWESPTKPTKPKPPISKPVQPRPTGKQIDIWEYIVGKPGMVHGVRSVKNGHENNETVTTIDRNGKKLFVKNGFFETIWLADHEGKPFVWRGLDTSAGNGRMYSVWFNGKEGAPWCPRHMQIGEVWHSGVEFLVQFYQIATGAQDKTNSGPAPNHIKLVEHYPEMKFVDGVVIKDVIKLEWVGHEAYYYGRDRGLVGWAREHNDPHTPRQSGVSELHNADRANGSDLQPISYASYGPPSS